MDFSLPGLWASMGFFAKGIAITLAVMSVASLAVLAERLFAFSKSAARSREFAAKLNGLATEGDFAKVAETGAAGAKKEESGHLGRVLGAGLVAFQSAQGREVDVVVESVARALERTTSRELAGMKRGLSIVATVASTAPFVGLLGTVAGIINSFQLMKGGSAGLQTVSAGISEALVTTAFGLLVAIPAVMGFNFLNGRVEGFAVDIAESANELLDLVHKHLTARKAA